VCARPFTHAPSRTPVEEVCFAAAFCLLAGYRRPMNIPTHTTTTILPSRLTRLLKVKLGLALATAVASQFRSAAAQSLSDRSLAICLQSGNLERGPFLVSRGVLNSVSLLVLSVRRAPSLTRAEASGIRAKGGERDDDSSSAATNLQRPP